MDLSHFRMNVSGRRAFCVLITFFVFSYPLYASNILPMRLTFALFVLGAFFIGVAYVARNRFDPNGIAPYTLWALTAIIAPVSFLASGEQYEFSRAPFLPCYVLSIIIVLACSEFRDWIMEAIKTLAVMLLPFALGTLVFYFVPDLFPVAKSVLFPDSLYATGYQSGLTTHYTHNGGYNAVGFLIASGFLLFGTTNRKERIIWTCVFCLFLFALLLIGKRQTLLFGALAVLIVFLLSDIPSKGKKLCSVVAVLFVACVVALQTMPGIAKSLTRFFETFGEENLDDMTNGREQIWESAVAGWEDSPLVGNGWGTFTYSFSPTNTVHVAHNEFLDLLYGTGLLGTIVFVVCVAITIVLTAMLFWGSQRGVNGLSQDNKSLFLAISLLIQVYYVSSAFSIGSLFGAPSSFAPYLFAVAISMNVYRDAGIKRKLRQFMSTKRGVAHIGHSASQEELGL